MDIREAVSSLSSELFSTVCLNYTLHSVPTKSLKLEDIETPAAGEQRQLTLERPVNVLKRVTLKSGFRQLTNSEKLSDFDLIAVRPNDEEDFHTCCTDADIDIISLKLEQKSIMRMRLNVVQEAIRRGIYFEIQLAPALRDIAARRYLIGNATTLLRATKGKNLILSSGARDAFETRSPYDLINFACVLGLTQQQAYDAVARNPTEALRHGAARKTFKGVVSVVDKLQFVQMHPEDAGILPSNFS